MAVYLFGLDDEHPSLATYKSLSDDRAAFAWASRVGRELNHNRREGLKMLTVRAYRADGTRVILDDAIER